MTPERWKQIKAVFDEALEAAPGARAALLDAACGGDAELRREVESLLASYEEAGDLLDEPAAERLPPVPLIGQTLGAYRVVRPVGDRAMGLVYLGLRDGDLFRRRVTIQVAAADRLDPETLRRFRSETQPLAVLDHPNIAKVLDCGETPDGIPYLVLDYVQGMPVEEYCNTRHLSTAERLQLFQIVCSAVHYGHQNLVVHRDLKPANILVTPEGAPRLLDFGIARLLRPECLQAAAPDYASPEQILGLPVTTASDIYSLGVLLYRLLTGRHPYRIDTGSALELERAICQTEPVKPSDSVLDGTKTGPAGAGTADLARRLRGDLDAIVLTALRKEPRRRYASAEHFAEDIRRHLAGLPVAARGDSPGYRAARFASRHRVGVALAALAAALLATAIVAQTARARAERRGEDLRIFANSRP